MHMPAQARLEGEVGYDAGGRVATDDLLEWWFVQQAFLTSPQYLGAVQLAQSAEAAQAARPQPIAAE